MHLHRIAGSLALATTGLLFACDRTNTADTDRRGVANTQPTAPPQQVADRPGGVAPTPDLDDPTVDLLTDARCALEAACPSVGVRGSRDECLTQMRAAVRHNLGAFSCDSGFDSGRARGCAVAIQRASCARPITALEQIPECSSDSLCAP